MSKISKMLQCSDCLDKLNEICDTLEYNDCEREIVAEVLLYLEMQKLKSTSIKKSMEDIIDKSKTKEPYVPIWQDYSKSFPYDWYTTKC